MSVTKESLHTLIDYVDTSEYDVLFKLLVKFIPSDLPTDDEIESLRIANQQVADGEVYRLEDIDDLDLS